MGAQPIPRGVALIDAARQTVAAFIAAPPTESPFHEVEGVEVVQVSTGPWPSKDEPGVELRWRQGENRYGLLIPIERLARQSGGLDGAPFYLRLAVDEPHGPVPEGTRLWFSDLPSGPY